MMKSLGMIGLGAMGRPIAERFLAQGYRLFTTVRSERSRKLAESLGIAVLSAPKLLPEVTDTVLLLVSNYAQCSQLLTGENGLFSAMKHGTVILSSTVAPKDAAELSAACPAGVQLLDAPVSGGVTGAETGTLLTMVAGDRDTFLAYQDFFSVYAKKATYVSPKPGQAQALKAINQMLVGIHIVATAEAAALASSMNLDLETLYSTISECAGNSTIFRNRMPKLINRDFSPRASLETLVKDTGICMNLAEGTDTPCYLTEICNRLYRQTLDSSVAPEDACSVIRMYEEERPDPPRLEARKPQE